MTSGKGSISETAPFSSFMDHPAAPRKKNTNLGLTVSKKKKLQRGKERGKWPLREIPGSRNQWGGGSAASKKSSDWL